MSRDDARQDELLGEMVLAIALHYGIRIDFADCDGAYEIGKG